VLGNGLVNVAEQRVSSGLASVLVATMPLWATLIERFTGGRTLAREWIGIGLGLAGVVILNLGGEMRASGMGAVCALLAPMAWALGSIVSKRLPLPGGAMRTATQMVCGGAAMALVSLAFGEYAHHPAVTGRAIGAIAYLAAFGSLAGFSAYNYLLSHTRTAVATSYAYVNPVIAVGLGIVFAGEKIDAVGAVGAVTILAAVLMITRGKAAAAKVTVATPVAESAPSTVVVE
jgi:drug/metabolite transporter (DMT)-like permease